MIQFCPLGALSSRGGDWPPPRSDPISAITSRNRVLIPSRPLFSTRQKPSNQKTPSYLHLNTASTPPLPFTLIFHSYKMSDDEKFDAPDADNILRALGPPERDFRVHKFLLSLASPVFKHMFSLPRPTSDNSGESTVAEVEIVEVTDPAEALDIVLRMIYPSFTSPSLGRDFDFDTLVECLVIADKYEIRKIKLQLCDALVQVGYTRPLRVYAIAARFGFARLMDLASHRIFSSIHFQGSPNSPTTSTSSLPLRTTD